MSTISALVAIVVIRRLRKPKQKLILSAKPKKLRINYVLETQKLLILARKKYESKHIKDAYEKFSHAKKALPV